MSIKQPCPEDAKLSELLDGRLLEPELSKHAEHLEHCDFCQQKVGTLSSKSLFAEALIGNSDSLNSIAAQTPRALIERIKQIPMFCPDRSSSVDSSSSSSQHGVESIHFSADPTPGGLGRLGPYRILRLLGSGGMGSVFLAEDTKLHRQVAIKVMLPRIAADPIAKERFVREAQAAASLKSEHVVRIYQVDEENNLPYLTMEYLEGQSLDELIQSSTQLDVPEILSIVSGVLRGLADAHESGLIHRDIKPGNIWIQFGKDSSPRVKILDFGLARWNVNDTQLTQVDAIVGTPAFMAPEQARGEKSVDARSDLFSLGCVLYYLCTKEVPFKSDTTIGTLMALAVETPDPPCSRNAAIPWKLSQLTMQLLEKEPNNRPQTTREVLATLKELGRELQLGIARYGAANDAKNLPGRKANRVKNRGTIFWGFSSVVLAVYAVYFFSQPKSESTATHLPMASVKKDVLQPGNQLHAESNEQIDGVLEQFKLLNARFMGGFRPTFDNGKLVELTISGSNINNLDAISGLNSLKSLIIEGGSTFELVTLDLSPIQKFELVHLALQGGYITKNLDALSGMPLEELSVTYSPVSDLTPLQGMPLRKLGLWSWAGSDLSALQGMPLEEINIGGNGKAIDLTPLAGAPLRFFCANLSAVCDLTPLRGMPLRQLYCSNTRISDLSPVQDCPIEELMVEGTLINDISIAKSWPLNWIEFDYDLPNWWETLKDIPTLKRIRNDNAAKVLAEFDPSIRPESEADFVNGFGMEFALVPKGKTMRPRGNFDKELGSREIEIENDFYLGRFEVTQAQWMELMDSNPSHFSKEGPGASKIAVLSDADLARLPVERVSWTDCQQFVKKLNELNEDADWTYRLPTEAEWTYACQGGPMDQNFDVQNLFYFTRATTTLLPYQANSRLCGFQRPCKVGLFAPNPLGLFDMHGNVWEWCEDLANLPEKRARWIHGGSWRDEAERCQVSFLLEPTEPWNYFDLGFRVARVRK